LNSTRNDDDAKLFKAYKSLSEDVKRNIFAAAAEHQNQILLYIQKEIPGHYRPKVLAGRTKQVQQAVDAYLENSGNVQVLKDLLNCFLASYTKADGNGLFDEFHSNEITESIFEKFLESVRSEGEIHSLMQVCYECGFHDFTIKAESFLSTVKAKSLWAELEHLLEQCEVHLRPFLDNFTPLSQENIELLSSVNEKLIDLRQLIEAETRKLLGKARSWNSADEFDEIITDLEHLIEKKIQEEDDSKSGRNMELLSFIQNLEVRNKSTILKNAIEETKTRAAAELQRFIESNGDLPKELQLTQKDLFTGPSETLGPLDSETIEILTTQGLVAFVELFHMRESLFIPIKADGESEEEGDLSEDSSSAESMQEPSDLPDSDTEITSPSVRQEDVKSEHDSSNNENLGSDVKEESGLLSDDEVVKIDVDVLTPEDFDKTKSLQDIIASTDWNKSNDTAKKLHQLVLQVLIEGYYGLAYNLLKNIDGESDLKKHGFFIDPLVLQALVLSQKVNYRNPQITAAYDETIGQLPLEAAWLKGSEPGTEFHKFILFGCSVWTGVSAPSSVNDVLLRNLNIDSFPDIGKLIHNVLDFSKLRLTTAPDLFKNIHNMSDWETIYDKTREDLESWLQSAKNFRYSFAPAHTLWAKWINQGGVLNILLVKSLKTTPETIQKLKSELASIDIEEALALAEKRHLRTPLHGTTRRTLVRHAYEALEWTKKMAEIIDAKPSKQNESLRRKVEALETSLRSHTPNILKTLNERIENKEAPFLMKVAWTVASNCLKNTSDFFLEGKDLRGLKDNPFRAMRQELVLLPSLDLDSKWISIPESWGTDQLKMVFKDIQSTKLQPNAIMLAHLEKHDLRSARRLIDWSNYFSLADEVKAELADLKEKGLLKSKIQLKESLFDCERQLTGAFHNGLIQESKYDSSRVILKQIRSDFEASFDYENYFEAQQKISAILKGFSEDTELRLHEIDQRIEGIKNKAKPTQLNRIRAIVKNRNVHVANDFIDRIIENRELPLEDEGDSVAHLKAFYSNDSDGPAFIDQLSSWLEKKPSEQKRRESLNKHIIDGRNIAGLSMSTPVRQRNTYALALDIWFTFKQLHKIDNEDKLALIFEELGFLDVRIKSMIAGSKSYYEIQTEPLISGTISRFGSEANGLYHVFYDFNTSSPEQILANIDVYQNKKHATILLYFGRLRRDQRKQLESQCRKAQRTVVVIDDLMMIYLASIKGRRLISLLECTMPFTHFKPYTISASILPPEMFYGRRKEISDLESMGHEGSCLLYGGRQIGKTVLLRNVHRRVNRPKDGSISRFIDLKRFGIGTATPVEGLWELIVKEINKEEKTIFKDLSKQKITPSIFSDRVLSWLKEDSSRRILLLLDEADGFLHADSLDPADPYLTCSQLKGLMEETSRRFKVVFSGLHNVQRATKVVNSPLAHYGSPLCIGPMLHSEFRDAQRLVEVPLGNMGILFESSDLVIQVLAQANYYPNLIQIYCNTIMDYVSEKRDTPKDNYKIPTILTAEDLNNIYERQQLRDGLRDRFRLTLDLDNRFKLIANILAFYNDYREDDGFTSDWIRERALDVWEAGFSEPGLAGKSRAMDHEDFLNILNEMVGLGILRNSTKSDYYDLRSPNVLSLLGSTDYLSNSLESAKNLETPIYYELETFRRPLNHDRNDKRSALTSLQESKLRVGSCETFLIIGSTAGGLNSIGKSLVEGFGHEHVKIHEGLSSKSKFVEVLRKNRRRKSLEIRVEMIADTNPWDQGWIECAQKELKIISKKKLRVQVIFVANEQQVWNRPNLASLFESKVIHLKPWSDQAVRLWLNDANLGNSEPETRNMIRSLTGYWPEMLENLFTFLKGSVLNGERLNEYEAYLKQNQSSLGIIDSFIGVKALSVTSVLKVMAEWDNPMSADDIQSLNEDDSINLEDTERVLHWAEQFNYVRKQKAGWKIDEFLGRLLNAS
jgi:hypothetical protein